MTIEAKLEAILAALNAITDEEDDDITEAVQSAKEYVTQIVSALNNTTRPAASGTKTINSNGTHDCSGYAYVNVQVPTQLNWVESNGTLTITEVTGT